MDIRHSMRVAVGCAALVLPVVFAAPAMAATSGNSGAAFSANSPNLLGDWGGARTNLAKDGVFLFFDYDGQAVHNFSGGTHKVTRLANQWVLGSAFDFGKLFGWKGAGFTIMVTNRSGRDPQADAGLPTTLDVVNNYGAGETWWLTEFAFDQKFANGKVDWRIGRMPAGTDFNKTDLCDFMNLVFCGTPFTNVTNYSTFFNMGRWGTRLKFNTHGKDYFAIGVYQVSSSYYDSSWAVHHGLSLAIPHTDGWMYQAQYGWNMKVGGMPGSYQFGGWYSTADQALASGGTHSGNYGAWFDVDQRLTNNGSGRGYSLFFNIVQRNPDTTGFLKVNREVNLGLKYHQPFNRPNDYVGIGIGSFHHIHDGAANHEYDFEAFYKWSAIKSVQFLPNVEYVIHPGGEASNKNVFLVGLTTQISF